MTARAHILIVEDEPKIATLIRRYLTAAGFDTSECADGAAVVDRVREHQPDLVLLDLMLPGRDGMSVCQDLRTFSPVPIIMVTARAEQIDKLLGLEIGADDYICKPFDPQEVVARVNAVLRRSLRPDEPATAALFGIDLERMEACYRGQPLPLTQVEFRLLKAFCDSPGKVFSRDQLMQVLYLDHRVVGERTVDSHVKNLRRKIVEAGGDESLLRSIYGVGYRLD